MSDKPRRRGGRRTQRAIKAAQAIQSALISKSYFYAGSGAGVEHINSFAEFASYHIQDDEVALSCLETMLVFGESRNEDLHEGVMEEYTIANRPALVAHLRELLDNEPELFENHDELVALLATEPQ